MLRRSNRPYWDLNGFELADCLNTEIWERSPERCARCPGLATMGLSAELKGALHLDSLFVIEVIQPGAQPLCITAHFGTPKVKTLESVSLLREAFVP